MYFKWKDLDASVSSKKSDKKEVAEESGRREKKRKGKRKQSFMFVKVRNVNIISFFR